MRAWTLAARRRLLLATAASLGLGCAGEPPRDLGDLVARDSLYFEPGSREPFTGDVVRYFGDEPDKVQLRGTLRDGTWNGELVVYHPNGRVRYQGALADGAPCGPWTENRDPEPPADVLTELRQEIEAMGLYPPCPEER